MPSGERRTNSDAPPALSLPTMTGATLNTTPKVADPYVALSDQYAVLVSYRCNYTGKLLVIHGLVPHLVLFMFPEIQFTREHLTGW